MGSHFCAVLPTVLNWAEQPPGEPGNGTAGLASSLPGRRIAGALVSAQRWKRPAMQPDTHYAKSGEVRIAYQVFGEGAFDLVYVPGFISNIDLYWDTPQVVPCPLE